ncbi:NifB/NifX family molybdenum-iron cluster-binding protein [Phaeospirillum tilakii]|uniref:NifB/NifX family molybdenum-iron cluster-binding protein n=1 Tax=Phaeospirillum tilakii TaxID=741673 RepID=A0ABW5C7R4_9PROT
MKIALAVNPRYSRLSGHAGRARHWLVWTCDESGPAAAPERLLLEPGAVFHHHPDGRPHPLDGIDALLTQSAGEGFVAKMKRRGIDIRLTAERDPRRAVEAYLSDSLPPPRPRPIGDLVCKLLDRLLPPAHGG